MPEADDGFPRSFSNSAQEVSRKMTRTTSPLRSPLFQGRGEPASQEPQEGLGSVVLFLGFPPPGRASLRPAFSTLSSFPRSLAPSPFGNTPADPQNQTALSSL